MNLADLIRKGPAGERSQESQKSQSQRAQNVNSLRPSARLKAERSQESQESQSQPPANCDLDRSLPNNNNNNKVILYRALRAQEKDSGEFATATLATFATDTQPGPDAKIELRPVATATLATFATDGPNHRLWDIRTPAGWLEVATCPPASLATMRADYPEAIEIIPAEEDHGTAFYRRLFAGMDAPRASVTLNPEETHRAVVAGLVRPEEARNAVLLATRDAEGNCALMAIPADRWDPFATLAMLEPEPGTLH